MIYANYNPKPWTLYIKQKTTLKSREKAEQLGALGSMERLCGKFFGFSFCLISIHPRSEAQESSNLEMPTGREKNKHLTKCCSLWWKEQENTALARQKTFDNNCSTAASTTENTVTPPSHSPARAERWARTSTSGGHNEAARPPPGPTLARSSVRTGQVGSQHNHPVGWQHAPSSAWVVSVESAGSLGFHPSSAGSSSVRGQWRPSREPGLLCPPSSSKKAPRTPLTEQCEEKSVKTEGLDDIQSVRTYNENVQLSKESHLLYKVQDRIKTMQTDNQQMPEV